MSCHGQYADRRTVLQLWHVIEIIITRTLVLAPIFVLGFSKEVIDIYIVNARARERKRRVSPRACESDEI